MNDVRVEQIEIAVAPLVNEGMDRNILCKRPKEKNGFRLCLATTYHNTSLWGCCCNIPYFYIAFCGHERTIPRKNRFDYPREYGQHSEYSLRQLNGVDVPFDFLNYPFCGGCNITSKKGPVIELPCCIACFLWPIVFPFVWFMSYVSNYCSAGFGYHNYAGSFTHSSHCDMNNNVGCCCDCEHPDMKYYWCCCGCCIGNDADLAIITTDLLSGEYHNITSCFNCCGKERNCWNCEQIYHDQD